MTEIQKLLFAERDEKYAEFQHRLMPTVPAECIIGVRTPKVRALAKTVEKLAECEDFLATVPHEYYDENQLHICILSDMKDFDRCIEAVEAFLPYIDNWATCDMLAPKVFKKNKARLLPNIEKWIASGETYTVRFGIEMLMSHYLDGDFKTEYLDLVTSVRSDEYYVNMQTAWFMATALTKQWDASLPYVETQTMDTWTHNKTIQKAIESRRISDERKAYLRTLKK